MKVLIGVDHSRFSEAALELVRKSAWPPGTHFIVVSAVAPIPLAYADIYLPVPAQNEEVISSLTTFHAELAARGARTLKDNGLDAEGRVLQGDARDSILELARTENVDLIVVGSHGRTGLTKMLMGSVASHVVTHAHCSVLVVRH